MTNVVSHHPSSHHVIERAGDGFATFDNGGRAEERQVVEERKTPILRECIARLP